MRPQRYGSRRRAVEERVDPLDTFGGLLADIAAEMSPVVNMYRAGLFEDEYPTTPFATPRDRMLSLLEEPEYQRYVDNIASAGMGATTKVGRVAKALPAPRTKAEAAARDVLEMRAAGKAEKVTDEMMAAADPQYLFENTPLPMDEASRMARAREMGFDTGTPLYHGTPADFQSFSRDGAEMNFGANQAEVGHFLTNSPRYAAQYTEPPWNGFPTGPNIQPNFVRGRFDSFGRDVIDDIEQNWTPSDVRTWREEIEGSGFQGVSFGPVRYELQTPVKEVAVFDPANIRSRFARFDPEFRHLANLSAGVGGLGILSLLEPEQEVP